MGVQGEGLCSCFVLPQHSGVGGQCVYRVHVACVDFRWSRAAHAPQMVCLYMQGYQSCVHRRCVQPVHHLTQLVWAAKPLQAGGLPGRLPGLPVVESQWLAYPAQGVQLLLLLLVAASACMHLPPDIKEPPKGLCTLLAVMKGDCVCEWHAHMDGVTAQLHCLCSATAATVFAAEQHWLKVTH